MKKERSIAVRIPKKHAESTRKYLLEHDILRRDLKIDSNKEYVYFPLETKLENRIIKKYQLIEKEFSKKKIQTPSYKELLSLPNHVKRELPSSFDIIGDILLIKLPPNVIQYKKQIGNALLQTQKNINIVCHVHPVRGELRTREIDIIAGEDRTTTIHTEYGLRFNVDIQNTYFSPRLANERKRVASLVQPGETIVDMFTGVAPFSIMIAKYADPKHIYAVDKNKNAIRYAQNNINKNNVLDKIELIHDDAEKIPYARPTAGH